MVSSNHDHQRIAAAHAAPRCRHIHKNGRQCGSPALHGESHCYFHKSILPSALDAEDMEHHLPFIEDATSLQFALMRVMRLLLKDGFEFKRAALLLYSLQIACSNLKNFRAERPQPHPAADQQPQPECGCPRVAPSLGANLGSNGASSLEELLIRLLPRKQAEHAASGQHTADRI